MLKCYLDIYCLIVECHVLRTPGKDRQRKDILFRIQSIRPERGYPELEGHVHLAVFPCIHDEFRLRERPVFLRKHLAVRILLNVVYAAGVLVHTHPDSYIVAVVPGIVYAQGDIARLIEIVFRHFQHRRTDCLDEIYLGPDVVLIQSVLLSGAARKR